jgi:hypothetical protein
MVAEAALRDDEGSESEMVRRLMARSLRLVEAPVNEPEAHRPPPLAFLREQTPPASAEVDRLKAEILVMKAVLRSQQDEIAQLRACLMAITDPEIDPAPLTPEAQAVRDRWATLVDRLLQASH